ncbi:MAG: hypothetical protein ACRDS9_01030 [Pseudonocardiaceae bacterium]
MTAEILERGRALANDAARLVKPWKAGVAVHREELVDAQTRYTNMGLPRRVYVNAMEGVSATVVVTVVQGKVWMSISPPFTHEAIMELGKVDELLHVLQVAREDAKKTGSSTQ